MYIYIYLFMNSVVVQQLQLQPPTMSAGLTTKQRFCVPKELIRFLGAKCESHTIEILCLIVCVQNSVA